MAKLGSQALIRDVELVKIRRISGHEQAERNEQVPVPFFPRAIGHHGHADVQILRHDERRGGSRFEEVRHFGSDDEQARILQHRTRSLDRSKQAVTEGHRLAVLGATGVGSSGGRWTRVAVCGVVSSTRRCRTDCRGTFLRARSSKLQSALQRSERKEKA